jgi:hypothetical protein
MSSYNKEIFKSLEEKIKSIVIPSLFSSLILEHQEILANCVFRVILAIIICFNCDEDIFYQLEQNNYQDIKWVTYLLLPYLKEDNNNKIKNFSDIFLKKTQECDINETEPIYMHSNMQYNMFNRQDSKNYVELPFTVEILYQNYYFLINSIKTCANKLHVNWMDILPYTYNNYKSTLLFKNTYEKAEIGAIIDWDPLKEFSPTVSISDILENAFLKISGLQIVDIYNTMSIYLYEEIVSVKWLIFDIIGGDDIYPQIYILNEIFDLRYMIADIAWDELTFEQKIDFTDKWNILLTEAKNLNDLKLNFMNITNESLRSLLRSMIIFFNFGSFYIKQAESEGYKT